MMSIEPGREPAPPAAPQAYDALLIVSFGGPEGPADVLPFLDNVLRGLSLPPPVKMRIARRYEACGGVSPINEHTRRFIEALQHELDAHGPALPIYWGNRNWHPLLPDTLQQMARDGVGRALAFVTSMFSSYSGCRKYREDLYEAVAPLAAPPALDKLRMGFNHPGFIEAVAKRIEDACRTLTPAQRAGSLLLFSAHSLPESMARHCRYEAQLQEACRLAAAAAGGGQWRLVYQSNNASYGKEAWLGPDIREALSAAAEAGVRDVVVMPIGFICDHLEVVLDLDQEAAAHAAGLGLNMLRAATVGTHPAFIGMVRELVIERMTPGAEHRALGKLGPAPDVCPIDCCLSGRPGPAKPALCGARMQA